MRSFLLTAAFAVTLSLPLTASAQQKSPLVDEFTKLGEQHCPKSVSPASCGLDAIRLALSAIVLDVAMVGMRVAAVTDDKVSTETFMKEVQRDTDALKSELESFQRKYPSKQ